MATKGDKLSPIFKSLRPDESHLESVAASAVQDAELRWPLFRAIAPTKSAPAPALTDEDRANWSSTKATRATPQHKLALTVPGLSEQLAEGLNKMVGNKAAPRKPSAKAKAAATPSTEPNNRGIVGKKAQTESTKPAKPPAPKPEVVMPQASEALDWETDAEQETPSQPVSHHTALPEPATEPVVMAQPAKPSVKKMYTAVAPTAAPAAAPVAAPTPSPVANAAEVTARPATKPAPARQPTATVATAPRKTTATEPLKPPKMTPKKPQDSPAVETKVKAKPATNPVKPAARTEPLKNLFSRLETPEPPPPPPKPAAKKPSFLGRLGKR